jgi:hypothetical protein
MSFQIYFTDAEKLAGAYYFHKLFFACSSEHGHRQVGSDAAVVCPGWFNIAVSIHFTTCFAITWFHFALWFCFHFVC